MVKFGSLYIVATPIGNYADISSRAIDVLNSSDAIICEEFREASTLLKKIGIQGKQLLQLNEHSEQESSEEFILLMVKGKNLALISDAGTPGFADPGPYLIKRCVEMNIPVRAIPGPSSLMAAISLSPLPLKEFFFAGFLPRKDNERKSKFLSLRDLNNSLILMDTPYRLGKLLDEVKGNFGPRKLVTLAIDLTLENEELLHGTIQDICAKVKGRKGEFILIVHKNPSQQNQKLIFS